MRMITFAAIDIGAFEVVMKIFTISEKRGMKEVDCVRRRMELGADTYALGTISREKTEQLCETLTGFRKIMDGYHVDVYRACGKSALRETSNILTVLDQIKSRTGIQVDILSNSEHRFINYKSIAFQGPHFVKMIEKPTAILDVGEGSLQISLFNKECLVTTQNIRLGPMRLREKLSAIEEHTTDLAGMIGELVGSELHTFRKLYWKEKEVKNLIILGNFLPRIVAKATKGRDDNISREELLAQLNKYLGKEPEEAAEKLEVPSDEAQLLSHSMMVYRALIEGMDVEQIWTPALSMCEGLAYEYAAENHYIKMPHNFENDILAASKNIAKRYQSNSSHIQTVGDFALVLFDGLRAAHGMDKRDRLLLQITALLHSCGKYVSMSYSAQCAYNIIASTEIIGLSHNEREIVAYAAMYNTAPLPEYHDLSGTLSADEYIRVAKLTAILRVANEVDRGHKQKYRGARTLFKEGVLRVTIDASKDMALEIGMMNEKKVLLENLLGTRLVIRQKKLL